MGKNNYVGYIYCKELETDIKGFFSKYNMDVLSNNSHEEIIMQGMEYRPDKVSAYYLGNERLSWMIDLANNFTEGMKEYYLGRKIKIPNPEADLNLRKE